MNKRRLAVIICTFSFVQTAAIAGDSNTEYVDGASVGSFMGTGAVVNPMNMERASMQADQFVDMPPSHNVKVPKPGKKRHKFADGVGRAVAHTANFVGFPVGDDKDVDASLSSDLVNEENKIKVKEARANEDAQEAAAKAAKEQANEQAREISREAWKEAARQTSSITNETH
jgi:hypothetical protein